MIYILKRFTPRDEILTLCFLITFSRTKLHVVLIRTLLVSVYLTIKIRNFPTYNVSDVSRFILSARCVTAANNICRSLNVYNKHNISLDDTFPLLTRTELRHHPVTCILLLPRIKIDCSFSSSPSLAFVMYTFITNCNWAYARWQCYINIEQYGTVIHK
jgi:hypothetical protein